MATSATSEVVKLVLDKLTEAAQAAGQTAGAAWPHVVTAYAARQIGYMLVGILICAVGSILILRCRGQRFLCDPPSDNPTRWLFVFIAGVVAATGGGLGIIVNFADTLAVIADPAGAFILALLNK